MPEPKTFTVEEIQSLAETYLSTLIGAANAYGIAQEEQDTARRVMNGFKNTVKLTADLIEEGL